MQRVLTSVTLLGLLVATAAAFVVTEHLKLIKSPLYGTAVPKVLSPVCGCPSRVARIGFRLRHPSRVTVTIVDASHHIVDTVASDVHLSARGRHHVDWHGETDSGSRAPDGDYYPWITLNGRRTYKLPNKIVLDTKPPKVLAAKGLKPVLLAGKGRTLAIGYSFSKKAHAVVYLGSHRIIRGRKTRKHAKIKWAGTRGGAPLPAGTYVLSIGAEDVFGNVTPAAGRRQVTVDVRYVELTPERVTVRSGKSFRVHVETAARHYTWRLGKRHGKRHVKSLRLRAPTTPGTYRLVVTGNGHSTTAAVEVRGK
ncbi:MAG TPA: FlgD immunoglobulin-like domain containing protein [Candidatus Limnocylindrales bacterium]|nr:FlgD immunoglobulin-like domain containing protein [Candidatus Limnocylindrales bacterium]